MDKSKNKINVKKLVMTALGAALLAVCSWLTIPSVVPFTLQTFGVFCIMLLLGGKYGTVSVAVYIALGAVGVPVFSGFQSGLGHLLGLTGGYIWGFLLAGMIYIIFEPLIKKKQVFALVSLLAGLLVCYIAGTVWFLVVAHSRGNEYTFLSVLSICVFPYIIPDLIKLAVAYPVCVKVRKLILRKNTEA
jgi:biotin transport system substrate-specific component